MTSFPYVAEKVKEGIVLRPEIPVVLSKAENKITAHGLVDSGSDITILPRDIATVLGISPTGKEFEINGLGNETLKAVTDYVGLSVAGSLILGSRVFIPTGDIAGPDQLILGHDPLFKEFNITFEYNAKRIVLNKIRH